MMPKPAPALDVAALMARDDLTPTAKVAAIAVAAAADASGLCSLTLTQLIAATKLPDRTLRRALHDLVEAGVLAPVRTAGKPACFAVIGGQPDWPAATMAGGQVEEKTQCFLGAANLAGGQAEEIVEQIQRPPPSAVQPPPHTPPITTSLGDLLGEGRDEGGSGGKKGAAPTRRVPHLLPPDWSPSAELLAYARRQDPHLDLDRLLREFVWFWTQERREKRADWNATFRKRVDALAGRSAGAAAPGGARAPSPASRPESDGMRRLRELATKMQGDPP